jgi:hypothetical protein
MSYVDLKAVAMWGQTNKRWVPTSIDLSCHGCGRVTNFRLDVYVMDNQRNTIACSGNCPACHLKIHVWIINPIDQSDKVNPKCDALIVYPKPHEKRQPIKGMELMPPRLQRAYQEVLDVYSNNVWSATATCSRRTLEGLLKNLLPKSDQKGTLANQLEKLSKSVELEKPLITLAHALREGGNLGAHFDQDKDPDQETAEAMLDLIEYLLEYVYTLPGMIERLEQRLSTEQSK